MSKITINKVALAKKEVYTGDKVKLQVLVQCVMDDPLGYRLAFVLGNNEHKIKKG